MGGQLNGHCLTGRLRFPNKLIDWLGDGHLCEPGMPRSEADTAYSCSDGQKLTKKLPTKSLTNFLVKPIV